MVQWSSRPLARDRRLPAGFIEPCQPVLSAVVPRGSGWIHELKHDGWRILVRKDGDKVHLWSRNGRDWSAAFPGIVRALSALPITSCIFDGEAVAHNARGWPSFHALMSHRGRDAARLIAFDLLAVNGEDIRPRPLMERRARLAELMGDAPEGLQFSEHMDNGPALFRHACLFNLEGIVSKRKDAPYRSGRRDEWRKIKCPEYARDE